MSVRFYPCTYVAVFSLLVSHILSSGIAPDGYVSVACVHLTHPEHEL